MVLALLSDGSGGVGGGVLCTFRCRCFVYISLTEASTNYLNFFSNILWYGRITMKNEIP